MRATAPPWVQYSALCHLVRPADELRAAGPSNPSTRQQQRTPWHTKIGRGTRTKEYQMTSNLRPDPGVLGSLRSEGGKGSYASKTATTPVSTTCCRHLPTP